MGFDMILDIFVEHPIAAVVCLLIGGGILFGIFGGFTGIEFFTDNWYLLIKLGIFVFIFWLIIEFAKNYL